MLTILGAGGAGESQRAGLQQQVRSRASSPDPPPPLVVAHAGRRDREANFETSAYFGGQDSLHRQRQHPPPPRTPSSRSVGSGSGSATGGMLPSSTVGGVGEDQPLQPPPRRPNGINVIAAAAGGGPPGGGHGGEIPPTPSSTTSSGGHSSRSGVRGGSVNVGGRSVSPIGNGGRRQSPLARPQGGSSRGGGAGAAPRGAQVASAMPHGLTVQELKELTKVIFRVDLS